MEIKDSKIKNSVVLITGADRGVGRAFVEEFLKADAGKIYLGMSRPEKMSGFSVEDQARLIPLQLDVTKADQVRAAAKKAADVSSLINNAGVLYKGSLLDKDRMEKARYEMNVNYFGLLDMVRAFVPVLEANGGGVIVNMSSVAGLVAIPDLPTYSASKAAAHFLTIESCMELREKGINIVGVYPGPIDTDTSHSTREQKVTPNDVARKTIKAIESGEHFIFPDPFLKDIYSVLHGSSERITKKMGNVFPEQEVRAA